MEEQDYKKLEKLGIVIPGWDGQAGGIKTKYGTLRTLEKALKKQQQLCIFTEDTESKIVNKAKNITGRLHGLYQEAQHNYVQQQWYTRLLSGMKGYSFGMFTHRYANSRFNAVLRKRTEGAKSTVFKLIYDLVHSLPNSDTRSAAWAGLNASGIGSGVLASPLVAALCPPVALTFASINLLKGLPMMIWGQ